MSVRNCFTGKVANGKVAPLSAARVNKLLQQAAQPGAGPAVAQAALQAAQAFKKQNAIKAANLHSVALVQNRILSGTGAYDATMKALRAQGKAPLWHGNEHVSSLFASASSFLDYDMFEIATWTNVHHLTRRILDKAHTIMADAMEELRPKMLGFKEEAVKDLDLTRAGHGETSTPGAKMWIGAWNRVQKYLLEEFHRVKGDIFERPDYIPNPEFDPVRVRSSTFQQFFDFVKDRVDRAKMTDLDTGLPLTDAKFKQLTMNAYDAIRANGAVGAATSRGRSHTILARSREAMRFFVWKNSDAWYDVARAYGRHDSMFQAMMNHIYAMAEDIAMLDRFGRNPEAALRFIEALFDREANKMAVTGADILAAGGPKRRALGLLKPLTPTDEATRINKKIESNVRSQKQRFLNLWDEVTGTNRIPVNVERAMRFSEWRSALVSSQMMSAIISSLAGDPATMRMAAWFSGIPMTTILGEAVQVMGKGGEVFAAQMGVAMDSMVFGILQDNRIMGQTIRLGVLGRLGPAAIRAQGLRAWTARNREMWALGSFAHTYNMRQKAWDDLDAPFRDSLKRYGMNRDDWDVVRSTKPYFPRQGAGYIRAIDIDDSTPAGRQAAERFSQWVTTEMDYAILDRNMRARALIVGGSRPGTLHGEAVRSFGMYRMFTAAFMSTVMMRTTARGFRDSRRLTYGALSFIAVTVGGMLALQAKTMAAGKDPLPMDASREGLNTWLRAMVQGGGLGIFGDFFGNDTTVYGNTLAATSMGALFAAGEDIAGFITSNLLQRPLNGEPSHFAGDALYLLGRYTPFVSSFWATRTAFQRAVLDQLALQMDPNARDRFRGMENRLRREGSAFWWRPGQSAPARAPNLGNLMPQ